MIFGLSNGIKIKKLLRQQRELCKLLLLLQLQLEEHLLQLLLLKSLKKLQRLMNLTTRFSQWSKNNALLSTKNTNLSWRTSTQNFKAMNKTRIEILISNLSCWNLKLMMSNTQHSKTDLSFRLFTDLTESKFQEQISKSEFATSSKQRKKREENMKETSLDLTLNQTILQSLPRRNQNQV